MELTFIGLIQIVIGGAIVLMGSVRSALIFLVISALFDGSAAIALPALGGSSIPPVQFALLFTTMRIVAPKGGYLGHLPDAIKENKWIVFFAIYGVVMAYLGPRIFSGEMGVFPMRPDPTLGLFDTVPLQPTSQNFTAAFYLVGTLVIAVSSYIFCRSAKASEALVNAILIASWLHIATGVLDLATRGTAAAVLLDAFRNGGYSSLDLSISGFIRIRGVLPEASSYAGLGFAFFVATAELWYRSIRSKATGLAAASLAFLLVLSTASTAYVALAAYAIFITVRAMAFPSASPPGKLRTATLMAGGIALVIAILMALVPRLPYAVYELILDMTLAKPGSDSGLQRMFWALQGWDAFWVSFGLGVGPGSFRSSSMLTAIFGTMGVVGITTFALYLASVFKPSRKSSWGMGDTAAQSIGGALGTAAIVSLVPAAIASPNAMPAAIFSIMAGAAIALRAEIRVPVDQDSVAPRPFYWPRPAPGSTAGAR